MLPFETFCEVHWKSASILTLTDTSMLATSQMEGLLFLKTGSSAQYNFIRFAHLWTPKHSTYSAEVTLLLNILPPAIQRLLATFRLPKQLSLFENKIWCRQSCLPSYKYAQIANGTTYLLKQKTLVNNHVCYSIIPSRKWY